MTKRNKHGRTLLRLFACLSLITYSSAIPGTLAQPAANSAAPARKEVLDPSKFFGMASFGYAAAKTCPEVMEKVFCYCGCDLTDHHVSLLDCFTSVHGVDCHICQEEAILARRMNSDGAPIIEIQKAIDEKYSKDYPFENDTPAYKNYKATHYGVGATPTKGSKNEKSSKSVDTKGPTNKGSKGDAAKSKSTTSKVKFGEQVAGPEDPDAPPAKPKLKPGKQMSKCCGADEHKDGKK